MDFGPPEYPLSGTLDAVAPHVPPALVSAPAWAAVRAAAARLPAALAAAAYLECRLGEAGGAVDLILGVDAAGREILAGRTPAVPVPAPLRDDPAWGRLAALCRRWADAPGPTWRRVRRLWLEFDVAATGGVETVPAPSLFLALDREADPAEVEALLREAGDAILPGGVPPADRELVLRVLARRPAGSRVPYLGLLAGRAGAPPRVYLSGVGTAGLPAALEAAGWPGPAGEVEEVLAALGGEAPPPVGMIHVDAREGAPPRLGVELTLARPCQRRGEIAERWFLDRLAELGLCTPARREALPRWPGTELRTLPHELWPSRVERRVNCVKLVFEPGRPLHAKAYLLATPHPVRGRAAAGVFPARPASTG
jgi:hypothetical protein